ncbi:MAG: flagellar filament capping protein FliD [Pseudomonadaceae bacterium]|nr:flagellar filament capping protein FliD [Pseudomonadaceae bacterium]
MASIQSLGVGSGLLTTELVENIVSAEREATDLRLGVKRAEYEAQVSAFGAVRSSLDTLRSAVSTLSDSTTLLSKTVSSANEAIVTASASPEASSGVHTVEVLALARAHSLVTGSYDAPDSVVGEGTLDFRFGTTTFSGANYDSFEENEERQGASIVIDSSNNTLTGIRDAINEASIGVVASVVNDGDGYRLTLSSESTGAANSMEITVTESGDAGLSALAFNIGAAVSGTNLTQTVVAEDATVTIDGITVRRENNTVSEVIEGVTFTLQSLNSGNPTTVSIADDNAGLEEKMNVFVDAFNDVKALADELTAFDEDESSGSILTGDSLVRGVRNQLRRFLSGTLSGLGSGSIRSLVELGLTTNQNNGYFLEFDSVAFSQTLSSSADDVKALLADRSSATDERVVFTSFQSASAAGTYDVEISQVATQGYVNALTLAALDNPITIDDDNDELTVKVDGVSSAPLSIVQGAYASAEDLAGQIELQINADSAIQASNRTVSVAYNTTDQRFEFTSSRFGAGSSVAISAVDTASAATLGLDVDDGASTQGLDVAGSINGVAGIGSGQFLTVPVGPQPASSGFYRGASTAGFPQTLDANSNNFVISVDGVSSGTITLAETSYASGADLASEMQSQINADATLSASGREVSVAYDGVNDRFNITSSELGSDSTVSISSIGSGVEAALGLTVGLGTPGENAGRVDDDASGVQIQITGGEAGSRGSVTLVRGLMNQLDRYLDSALSFGGAIDAKLGTLDSLLGEIDQEEERFNTRINSLEARLRTQFAAADALISTLNSTSSFLDSQLSSLPSFGNSD